MIIIFFILLSSITYISSGTVLSFSQSSPSYDIVCPGDTLVFTCITSYKKGVVVVWRIDKANRVLINTNPELLKGFIIEITDTNDSTSILTSTATRESVPLNLHGTKIKCSGNGRHYSTLTVHIAGVPVSVINIKIIPINNNTVLMNWYYQKNDEVHCIQYYNITIISDDNINGNMINNESSATIPSLIIGTNYSFIIIPIDTIGREGPPSSLIQYIWNVPAQVVNISWDQISTDSITIWWNINEDVTLHYPPVHYIVSVHNITINTTDTNVTINGLYPNNEYTVYIKPVNAIGEGPQDNITVIRTEQHISTLTTSSTDMVFPSLPVSIDTTGSSPILMSSDSSIDDYDITQYISSEYSTIPLPSLTIMTQLLTNTEDNCSECCTSVITVSQSTCTGSIISSVAIAVPITGLLTGLITSIITSIIVYCIMKNKGNTLRERSPVDIGIIDEPIYHVPTEQQDHIIGIEHNTAYGHTL
uniref:Fibronectin type-III domain-containing protein n=1 Tax=Amphimedon queenslandica TaxID=400682 RepID=A0A1X7TX66_AMPQE